MGFNAGRLMLNNGNEAIWGQSSLPITEDLRTITYGNGRYVAFGGDTLTSYPGVTSIDGVNWGAIVVTPNTSWKSVVYGNGRFVLVGNRDYARYSTNGTSWFTSNNYSSEQFKNSVTYGNGMFVAVGSNTGSAGAASVNSVDGINWTESTMPSLGADFQNWSSVTYGNGRFVAVGSTAVPRQVAAYSDDGVSWTQVSMPSSQFWNSVAYGNGMFVAIGYNVYAYSTNGITWTQGSFSSQIRSLTYGNGMFFGVGGASGGVEVYVYSKNGISWIQRGIPELPGVSSLAAWYAAVYGNGRFDLVGSNTNRCLNVIIK